MSDTAFLKELIAEIMQQGYDRATAGQYAVLIGDTPVLDEGGNVLVLTGDVVLATLRPMKFFATE